MNEEDEADSSGSKRKKRDGDRDDEKDEEKEGARDEKKEKEKEEKSNEETDADDGAATRAEIESKISSHSGRKPIAKWSGTKLGIGATSATGVFRGAVVFRGGVTDSTPAIRESQELNIDDAVSGGAPEHIPDYDAVMPPDLTPHASISRASKLESVGEEGVLELSPGRAWNRTSPVGSRTAVSPPESEKDSGKTIGKTNASILNVVVEEPKQLEEEEETEEEEEMEERRGKREEEREEEEEKSEESKEKGKREEEEEENDQDYEDRVYDWLNSDSQETIGGAENDDDDDDDDDDKKDVGYSRSLPSLHLLDRSRDKGGQEGVIQESAANETAIFKSSTNERAIFKSAPFQSAANTSPANERATLDSTANKRAPLKSAHFESVANTSPANERATLESAANERAPLKSAHYERAANKSPDSERARLDNPANERPNLKSGSFENAARDSSAKESASLESAVFESPAHENAVSTPASGFNAASAPGVNVAVLGDSGVAFGAVDAEDRVGLNAGLDRDLDRLAMPPRDLLQALERYSDQLGETEITSEEGQDDAQLAVRRDLSLLKRLAKEMVEREEEEEEEEEEGLELEEYLKTKERQDSVSSADYLNLVTFTLPESSKPPRSKDDDDDDDDDDDQIQQICRPISLNRIPLLGENLKSELEKQESAISSAQPGSFLGDEYGKSTDTLGLNMGSSLGSTSDGRLGMEPERRALLQLETNDPLPQSIDRIASNSNTFLTPNSSKFLGTNSVFNADSSNWGSNLDQGEDPSQSSWTSIERNEQRTEDSISRRSSLQRAGGWSAAAAAASATADAANSLFDDQGRFLPQRTRRRVRPSTRDEEDLSGCRCWRIIHDININARPSREGGKDLGRVSSQVRKSRLAAKEEKASSSSGTEGDNADDERIIVEEFQRYRSNPDLMGQNVSKQPKTMTSSLSCSCAQSQEEVILIEREEQGWEKVKDEGKKVTQESLEAAGWKFYADNEDNENKDALRKSVGITEPKTSLAKGSVVGKASAKGLAKGSSRNSTKSSGGNRSVRVASGAAAAEADMAADKKGQRVDKVCDKVCTKYAAESSRDSKDETSTKRPSKPSKTSRPPTPKPSTKGKGSAETPSQSKKGRSSTKKSSGAEKELCTRYSAKQSKPSGEVCTTYSKTSKPSTKAPSRTPSKSICSIYSKKAPSKPPTPKASIKEPPPTLAPPPPPPPAESRKSQLKEIPKEGPEMDGSMMLLAGTLLLAALTLLGLKDGFGPTCSKAPIQVPTKVIEVDPCDCNGGPFRVTASSCQLGVLLVRGKGAGDAVIGGCCDL